MTTLIPAYGRDYKSQKAVQADWDANKDFIVADMFSGADGKPTNKQDCIAMNLSLIIRYDRLTKVYKVKS